MVLIRRLFQLSPRPLPLTRFSPGLFVVLQEILYQPFFALIRLLQIIMHFKSKTIFFFQLIAGWSGFCCFVYMCFLGRLSQFCYHELQIASYLHICIASYLVSHQIMWHNRRIHNHGFLKITSCCYISVF